MNDYIKEAIAQDLDSPANAALFDREKQKYSVLKRIDTVEELITIMRTRSGTYSLMRSRITRALIMEAQKSQSNFWNSLLLFLYFPMLTNLRRFYQNKLVDNEELEQMIFDAFLEVVRDFPVYRYRNHIPKNLRMFVQRHILRNLRKITRDNERYRLLVAQAARDREFDPFLEAPSDVSRIDNDEAAELLLSVAAGYETRENLELFITTAINKEKLRRHSSVDSVSGSRDASERSYQRLKRRRTRTKARLRKLLQPMYAQYLEQSGSWPMEPTEPSWWLVSSQKIEA